MEIKIVRPRHMAILFSSVVYHYLSRSDEFVRILGNTEESFIDHVMFFSQTGRCIGADDLLQGRFMENDKCILISFDDGLKEHLIFFARFLHAKNIKALFDIPTCIFDGEPANPQVVHFGTAYYGIRKWYAFLAEHVRMTYPVFCHLLPERPERMLLYDLLDKMKTFIKKELPFSVSRELLMWLYREYLLPIFPDFMERVYLSKADVRTIRALGHTIGCHTRTHGVLRCVEEDASLLAQELVGSKHSLENILQEEVEVFTYPFGSSDEILQQPQLLQASGFKHAYTTCMIKTTFDPLCIGRYSTYSTDALPDLERKMYWYAMSTP